MRVVTKMDIFSGVVCGYPKSLILELDFIDIIKN